MVYLMSYVKQANKYEKLAISGDFEKLWELAEIGRPMAQLALAETIEAGLFEPKDDTKSANYWINLAANAGLPYAMYVLALSLDGSERIHWLEKASEFDHPYAMLALSTDYFFGNGVEKNYVKHFELNLEASRFDIPIALRNVGDSYMIGLGVEENLNKAYEFYKRSRNQYISPTYWNCLSEFDKYCVTDADLGTDIAWSEESECKNIQDRLVAVTLLIGLEAKEKDEEFVNEVISSLGENTRRLFDYA